jgi:hypothetical protein
MLVAFFDSTVDELAPQRKGELLERLTRRLVEKAGFRDIQLRAKHSSLEYDVEARHNLTGMVLSGEAKAHVAKATGQQLTGFVGKLLPLAQQHGSVHGLFISASDLTPEAKDFLDSVRAGFGGAAITLQTLVGDEIPAFFARNDHYVDETTLRERVASEHGLQTIDTWFVASEHNDFFVCSCGRSSVESPTHYATFHTDGTTLDLSRASHARLRTQLADLLDLIPLAADDRPALDDAQDRRLPPVLSGTDWFDYKFPAPPQYFVGRAAVLSGLSNVIDQIGEGDTALRALQILSRSGVGKSSLLLKLGEAQGAGRVVTIDARNIRTPGDTRLVVSEAARGFKTSAGTVEPPSSQDDVIRVLGEIGAALGAEGEVGLIQIDQFESALVQPGVFASVLDLVDACTQLRLPIVWVFARKSDLAVTFDEGAAVNLARLNELSRSFSLEDFAVDESAILLDRLAEALGEQVVPPLREAISTFSAGFPWLHKRLCAHVLSMKDQGIPQRDLVQAGLRAEDLFEEDLGGLAEADKALLRRIASRLPATAAELSRSLEGEVGAARLTEKLNEFAGARLLRRSGDVYDTYNDVFKAYLVTERVPFKARYVFRVTPNAAMKLLNKVAEAGPTTLAVFQQQVGGNQIAVLNKLRELRLLGLIDPAPGRVSLSPETQAAVEEGRLGDLLRRRLRGNALVVKVLDLVAAQEEVALAAVEAELRRELPHVAVTDATWTQYAKMLAAWLHYAGLAQTEGNSLRTRELPAEEELSHRSFAKATFRADAFMPSVRPPHVVELVKMFETQAEVDINVFKERSAARYRGLLRDAAFLDLVEVDGNVVRPGRQTKVLLDEGGEITPLRVARLALPAPNVKAILEAAGQDTLTLERQKEVLAPFGSAGWTDETWKWRLGILRSWLTASRQAKSSRLGVTAA